MREQIKALTKKVNRLSRENKALIEERKDLANACAIFREMRAEYISMKTWMGIVHEHVEKQDAAVAELQRALNRAKEQSLTALKPYRSPLGKLIDEGSAPIDGDAVGVFRAPKA